MGLPSSFSYVQRHRSEQSLTVKNATAIANEGPFWRWALWEACARHEQEPYHRGAVRVSGEAGFQTWQRLTTEDERSETGVL